LLKLGNSNKPKSFDIIIIIIKYFLLLFLEKLSSINCAGDECGGAFTPLPGVDYDLRESWNFREDWNVIG